MQLETIISTLLSAAAFLKQPVQDAVSHSVKDLFDAARYYLRKKFGEGSDAAKVFDLAVEKPDSAMRKGTLVEESSAFGLEFDPEITRLAQQLGKLLPRPVEPVRQTVQVSGRSNKVQVAAGHIITAERHVHRGLITPDARHINADQRRALRAVIAELAERLVSENGGPNFAAAHRMLQSQFNVASYVLIPHERFPEALSFLKQRRAAFRSQLRRRNPDAYRNDFFRSIYAAAGQLGWDRSRVYRFAVEKLGLKRPLTSLKELGPNQLKSLADFMRREVARALAAD